MAGIDRVNGRLLDGWDHVQQSVTTIVTTHFGERVLRRWVGSAIPKMLGRNLTPGTVVAFFSALIASLEVREIDTGLPREPRFKIARITPKHDTDGARMGHLSLTIDGVYMPRGHLGDFTPDGTRSFTMDV